MAGGISNGGSRRPNGLLAEQRLRRTGLEVKLDKGFDKGVYCIYVEYEDLASRVGFEPAHRMATSYCDLLKKQLGQPPGCKLGETQDGSQTGDARRNRDLEATFLWFPIETEDGCFHDQAVRRDFEMAALRAGQAWDQVEARMLDRSRDAQRVGFRRQLTDLLQSTTYAHLDEGIKERLVGDVTSLVFPPRAMER